MILDLKLLNAIQNSDYNRIVNLLSINAMIVDGELNGSNCLHYAVQENTPVILRLLLENGANLAHLDSNGETPVEMAAREKRWDCVIAITEAE